MTFSPTISICGRSVLPAHAHFATSLMRTWFTSWTIARLRSISTWLLTSSGSRAMANTIQDHLPSSINLHDYGLSDGYSFSTYVAATDLRLDIMWWNSQWLHWWSWWLKSVKQDTHPLCSWRRWGPESPWHPQTTPFRTLQTVTWHRIASQPKTIQDLVF